MLISLPSGNGNTMVTLPSLPQAVRAVAHMPRVNRHMSARLRCTKVTLPPEQPVALERVPSSTPGYCSGGGFAMRGESASNLARMSPALHRRHGSEGRSTRYLEVARGRSPRQGESTQGGKERSRGVERPARIPPRRGNKRNRCGGPDELPRLRLHVRLHRARWGRPVLGVSGRERVGSALDPDASRAHRRRQGASRSAGQRVGPQRSPSWSSACP